MDLSNSDPQINIYAKMQRRKALNKPAAALFTDIDRCFCHPETPTETAQLEKMLSVENYGLVMLTGKDLHGMLTLPYVPKPDILAAAAGTEIFILIEGKYQEYLPYKQYLSLSGWDKKYLKQRLTSLLQDIRQKGIIIDFQPQDQEKSPLPQKEFKLSLDMTGSHAEADHVQNLFVDHKLGLVMLSKSPDNDDQFRIDVVPEISGKGGALEYICEKLLKVEIGFVAGNSGNDFDMLQRGLFPAILVGGASSEAVDALSRVKTDELTEHIFLFNSKRGMQKIFVGRSIDDLGPRSIIKALADPLFNISDCKSFSLARTI